MNSHEEYIRKIISRAKAGTCTPALEDAIEEATETADTLREKTEERARVLAMSDFIRELTRRDANKPRQE